MVLSLDVNQQAIEEFCEKWKIVEFAFFGSVLGKDFRRNSDLDVMVSFAQEARWGLFDMTRMKEDLEAIFSRSVDFVTRQGVEMSRNPYRRDSILSSAEVVYQRSPSS